jgi:hypothetical protein
MNDQSSIQSELAPGEQALWIGRPRSGLILRGADALAIPFSLLWAGFAVYWLYSAAASGAPLPFVLFGVPFVLVGVYVVMGRFFVDARQRAATSYAVTSQRVLIVSGLFSRKVKSLGIKALAELSLSERADGSGSITFGAQHPMASMMGGLPSGWPGMDQYATPKFDSIPEVRKVYETIRKAQAGGF